MIYNNLNFQIKSLQAENVQLRMAPLALPATPSPASKPADSDRKSRDMRNEIEMLRAEKQKLLDGEATTKQKVLCSLIYIFYLLPNC